MQPTDFIPADAIAYGELKLSDAVDFEREMRGTHGPPEPGYGEILSMLAACGYNDGSFESVLGAAGDDEGLVVLVGDRIADQAKMECLANQFGADRLEHWSVHADGCQLQFRENGEPTGFSVGQNTLVFATPGWIGPARAVSRGGKPARRPELLRRASKGKTAWFAGNVSGYTAEYGSVSVVADLSEVVGFVDVSSGFEFEVEGRYASKEAASASAALLEAWRRQGRLLAPQLGLPAQLLDRVKVRHRGHYAKVTVDLSKKDVKRIATVLYGEGHGMNWDL